MGLVVVWGRGALLTGALAWTHWLCGQRYIVNPAMGCDHKETLRVGVAIGLSLGIAKFRPIMIVLPPLSLPLKHVSV